MKTLLLSALLALACTVTAQAQFSPQVVYGEDDRLDLSQVQSTEFRQWARSTAAMVDKNDIQFDDGRPYIEVGTLADRSGVCRSEKFSMQPAVARCSGFLVGDDLLATAGHCVAEQAQCDNYFWVFGLNDMRERRWMENGKQRIYLAAKDIYSCHEIVETKLEGDVDYAVTKLDRLVKDRAPLQIRTEGRVAEEEPLVVIGHPSGLPTKVSAGAWVRDTSSPDYFSTNLDTFGGNSGSAVFNTDTGVVEGILVRGERDYIYDMEKRCRRVNTCEDDSCRGEDVTRIRLLEHLL